MITVSFAHNRPVFKQSRFYGGSSVKDGIPLVGRRSIGGHIRRAEIRVEVHRQARERDATITGEGFEHASGPTCSRIARMTTRAAGHQIERVTRWQLGYEAFV